jgi:hypothetical protein
MELFPGPDLIYTNCAQGLELRNSKPNQELTGRVAPGRAMIEAETQASDNTQYFH